MYSKTILVKELCEKTSCICSFDGTIMTELPIKEIYEIRYQILKPKVVVGKRAIALFGKILIKGICIKKEGCELFLAEEILNYKGFIIGEFKFHDLNPSIRVKSSLEGIFSEIVEPNALKIDGAVKTELSFTIEKEAHGEDFRRAQVDDCNSNRSSSYSRNETGVDYTEFYMENNAGYDVTKVKEEYLTEIAPGTEQNVTIILD